MAYERLFRMTATTFSFSRAIVPMAAVSDDEGSIIAPEVRRAEGLRTGFTSFAEGDLLFAKTSQRMIVQTLLEQIAIDRLRSDCAIGPKKP